MWGALIAAGATLVGQLVAQGQYDQAQALREQVLEQIKESGMSIPEFDALVAEQAKAHGDVQADPHLRGAQLDALSQLQDLSSKGGMDEQAQAQLAQAEGRSNQFLRSNNQAILNNRAARGLGGSGDELAALLSGSEAASQQNSAGGIQAAANARQRALEALMNGAGLAGNVRGQDFTLDQANRAAADEMARFNAGLRQDTNKYNQQHEMDLARLQMQQARDYANAANGVEAGADAMGDRYGQDFAAFGKAGGEAFNAYNQKKPYDDNGVPTDTSLDDWETGQYGGQDYGNQGTIGGVGGDLKKKPEEDDIYTGWTR
jgi:hypothetical protein